MENKRETTSTLFEKQFDWKSKTVDSTIIRVKCA